MGVGEKNYKLSSLALCTEGAKCTIFFMKSKFKVS